MSSTPPVPPGIGAEALAGIDGVLVERWVTSSDERAIAVAQIDGERMLVSVLPVDRAAGDAWAVPDRAGWDLPLVERRDLGSVTAIVEALPRGTPSTTWADAAVGAPGAARGIGRPDGPRVAGATGARHRPLPAFVAQLAARVADANAAGKVVGALHPALVFAADDGSLAGIAQRPLRAPLAAHPEGRAPLFATAYLVPTEVRGAGTDRASAPDDAFRLAAMAWRWRRGEPPFGTGVDEVAGVLRGIPVGSPRDALERMLAAAFDRDERRRPATSEIADAIARAAEG